MIADPNEYFEPEKQPEESQPEKMKFPRTYDACPKCGSKVRLAETAIQQLKDEGSIHRDSFPGGLMHQIPLFDQARPPAILGPTFKLPVMLVYWDICECGEMYCTKFDIQLAPAQMQMQKQSPPPGFRGFMPPGHRGN